MNAPFNGDFQVTNIQTGAYNDATHHDGLDLVALNDTTVYSTVIGTVAYAGWENPDDYSQGFGKYVCIQATDGRFVYFGHLENIYVETGEEVVITQPIGKMGSTGCSTGSHLHYCVRPQFGPGADNISEMSGIPNEYGIFNDGYVPQPKTADFELRYSIDSIKQVYFDTDEMVIIFK